MKRWVLVAVAALLAAALLAGCNAGGRLRYVGADVAKAAALQSAGVKASEASGFGMDMYTKNGLDYYCVSFGAGGIAYSYDVDALTGRVIAGGPEAAASEPPATVPPQTEPLEPAVSTPQPKEPTPSPTQAQATGTISAEEAKAIALALVPGATGADISEFETDYDDGRLEYEGKILYGGMEYEFEIDGYSAAVRSWEAEPWDDDD